MPGPVFDFFAADHRRLDALLRAARGDGNAVDLRPFDQFRAGILRHIAMEEKRLIPAVTAARGGVILPIAPKLRVDHGAIAALLVPTPRQDIIEELRVLLAPHNRREEEQGGLYQSADAVLGEVGAAALVAEMVTFPDVRLKPYNDGPAVEAHIKETLALSCRQWE